MPGPHGVPRADIIPLLHEGLSDRAIGRTLHTNPKRVGQIRRELGLPQYEAPPAAPIEEKWASRTTTVSGGHMRWTGTHRSGMPHLVWQQRSVSARRIAFQIGHGREPVGRVLPGCGHSWCVAPEHTTDQPMRHADALFPQIFRNAA
ncbi:hypothetical protein [Streptomyces sp. ME01-18h]|uniref:hypothetical protein n=1 Tax=Streptomyces sp. ME01-18h TaxID=462920 RepID=UPI0029B7F785|nr:hypothetical protein [Streptomyces sp. ME01-18h]MDX3398402.1 hypothetical protein [Streptomyces sp. ME01-18h]